MTRPAEGIGDVSSVPCCLYPDYLVSIGIRNILRDSIMITVFVVE